MLLLTLLQFLLGYYFYHSIMLLNPLVMLKFENDSVGKLMVGLLCGFNLWWWAIILFNKWHIWKQQRRSHHLSYFVKSFYKKLLRKQSFTHKDKVSWVNKASAQLKSVWTNQHTAIKVPYCKHTHIHRQ